jgi:hypothetical protein
MALTQNDFVEAVTKLNDLTRQQIIRWHPCNPPYTARDQGLLGMISSQNEKISSFEAIHDGRIIRITEYANPGTLLTGLTRRYLLDIRTENGGMGFEFPNVEGLSDLFQSVQAQRLDIEGFIRNLVAG